MKLPALRVENLACERGGRTLFRGLSFTVERGGGLVLTGPNGIGKTSLLRLLGGLLRPSGGRVWIEGGDAEAGLSEQSHLIGMREALKPSLTVVEHLRFWRDVMGGPTSPLNEAPFDPGQAGPETAEASNVLLRLQAHFPVAYLSSGQRRRLALARLFSAERPIWLLDEPFNALDGDARNHFRGQFTRFMAQGGILVAASHDALDLPNVRTLALRRDLDGVEAEPAA